MNFMECESYGKESLYANYSMNPLYPEVLFDSYEQSRADKPKYIPPFLVNLIRNCDLDDSQICIAEKEWAEFIVELKNEWNLFFNKDITGFIKQLHLKYVYNSPYKTARELNHSNSFNGLLDLRYGRNHAGSNCADSTFFLFICAEIVLPGSIQIAYNWNHILLSFQNPRDGTLWFFETTIRNNSLNSISWRPYSEIIKCFPQGFKFLKDLEQINLIHLNNNYHSLMKVNIDFAEKEKKILSRIEAFHPYTWQLSIEVVNTFALGCSMKGQVSEASKIFKKVILLSEYDLFRENYKKNIIAEAQKIISLRESWQSNYNQNEVEENISEANKLIQECSN